MHIEMDIYECIRMHGCIYAYMYIYIYRERKRERVCIAFLATEAQAYNRKAAYSACEC